jgi:ribonuclease BN (tRNA processing enzyme)
LTPRRLPVLRPLLTLLVLLGQTVPADAACQAGRVRLQMLGTHGPELLDGGASTGYLVWLDNQARVIIDTGPGTAQTFAKTGADFNAVSLVLFTHFHADHSAAFPAFIKASYFTQRSQPLRVVGPSGAAGFTPAADEFVARLFDPRTGLFPYLADLADPERGYGIVTTTVPWSAELTAAREVYRGPALRVLAAPVQHGPIPALGYRLEIAGCVLSFSGDLNGSLGTLPELARAADILVMHNAIPEDAGGAAARLHIKPSAIGQLAQQAGVRQLLLTHLMRRTRGRQAATLELIRREYSGPVTFDRELEVVRPESAQNVE